MDIPQEVEELRKDLIWAKHYLNQYRKLYLHGQKRIDLLNEIAPTFFQDLQRMFWNEMIISVARLTDPHVQGSNRNLSLKILSKLARDNRWEFQAELDDLVSESIKKAKPIIKYRMKLTAHRDLPTAMGKVELDDINVDSVDEVMNLAGNALNLVYLKLKDSTWSWDLVSGHDAGELIHYLKLALIYQEWSRQNENWKIEDELWNKSPYHDA